MLRWHTSDAHYARRKSTLKYGPFTFTIEEWEPGKFFEYFSAHFGAFTTDPIEQACDKWPHEVIARYREFLAELEQQLKQ